MRLSSLQKYILINLLGSKGQSKRNQFLKFYDKQKNPPKKDDQQGILTKSFERLIDKGLMIGYGRRTPEKWFIDEVSLMPAGRKAARRLYGRQQVLPLKIRKM